MLFETPPPLVATDVGNDTAGFVVAAADVFAVVRFFLTAMGIRDIRGFCSNWFRLRLVAKPKSLMGLTAALLLTEGLGGGAEMATAIWVN